MATPINRIIPNPEPLGQSRRVGHDNERKKRRDDKPKPDSPAAPVTEEADVDETKGKSLDIKA